MVPAVSDPINPLPRSVDNSKLLQRNSIRYALRLSGHGSGAFDLTTDSRDPPIEPDPPIELDEPDGLSGLDGPHRPLSVRTVR